MVALLDSARQMLGRRDELKRTRRGHEPGSVDVREESERGFMARPNFYYYESLGGGRPAWLPLYPYPRMVKGQALNFFSDSQFGCWPSELGLDEPLGAPSDWVQVVGQYVATAAEEGSGAVLNNENVLGGWLRGRFEASAVWNLVAVPTQRINRIRHQANPTACPPGEGGASAVLARGNDLWLGNTGLRERLLVPSDAAQNPPGRLQ